MNVIEQVEPLNGDEEVGEFGTHNFRVIVNGGKYFDNNHIVKINLPVFGIQSKLQNRCFVEEASSILITMKHGPGVVKNLILAAKEQTLDFVLELLIDDIVYNTWRLNKAEIVNMGFGAFTKGNINSEEEQIQCEVAFTSMVIDEEVEI